MTAPHDVPPRTVLDGCGAFARRKGVAIVLLKKDDWTVSDADRLFEETNAGRPSWRTLVQQLGTEPNPAVRKRLAELQTELEARSPVVSERRIAILADSAMSRGAITAWRWLTGNNVRAFTPAEVGRALSWLVDSEEDQDVLLHLYRRCRSMAEARPSSLAS